MPGRSRHISICFLLLTWNAACALADDKPATRPADSNPAGELADVFEFRSVLNDERATVAGKIEACDRLANIGPDAYPAAPALVNQLRRRGTLGRHAMKALLANDPGSVVDALAAALVAKDSLLRGVAAGALADMPDHADLIVPSMMGLLKSKDSDVRELASSVLERMGPAASKAIPLLLKELRSDEEKNSRAALTALQSIKTDADPSVFFYMHLLHLPALTAISQKPASALDRMGKAADLALADLVAESDSDDPSVRSSVASALSHIDRVPDECVPDLIELARGNLFAGELPSLAVRVRAISFLGRADPATQEVVQTLFGLIPFSDVGDAAARALGSIHDTDGRVADGFSAMLSQEVNLRRRAALALGGDVAQSRRALAKLTAALADEDLAVRRDCALAIARIGPDAASAVPALAANLHRGDESSTTAAIALAAIGAAARPSAPALIAAIRSAPLNPSSGEISTESDRLRSACAAALARIDPDSKAAADLVLDSVRRRDWIVRETLAPALANSRARQSLIAALIALTSDHDEMVRVNARCALRELNEGRAPATQPGAP